MRLTRITPHGRRGAFLAAAIVFAVTLIVYGSMLPSGVAVGDEAEAQTVPYILGIAHPTGFPAFTLAAWFFSHVLPIGTVAWRINAFTALCTALTAAGVAALAVALAGDAVVAVFAALAFAFGTLVWHGAIHANAQVLAQTCGIYALVASVLFARSGERAALVAACACCGFGIAAHPAAVWTLPAVGVALVWQRARLTRRTVLSAAAAFAAPLLLYAYLPLRSFVVAARGLDPAAAAPLFGAGNFDWDTNAARTWPGFLNEVLGQHEGARTSLLHAFDPRSFGEAATLWFGMAAAQYGAWLLLLAAAGVAVLAWSDRRALSVMLAGTLGGIAFAYVYRADTHLDRYLVLSFAVTAALAAACAKIAVPRIPVIVMRTAAAVATALVAGFAFANDRPGAVAPFEDGSAIVAAVQRDTPTNAIVVAQWNDAAALGYGAFVEHALGSRIIVSAWPSEYVDRYQQWSGVRPVILYLSPLSWISLPPIGLQVQQLGSTLPDHRIFEIVPGRPSRS